MTRFAWLQSRTQTLTVIAALAALAIAAAVTGIQLSDFYGSHVAHCQSGCDLAVADFLQRDSFLQQALDIIALVAPALLGIFWGGPLLARELETGSYRLGWTQSITRSRWLAAKLGIGASATVAIAGLLTLTVTWWYRGIDLVGSNQYNLFDRRDIVPIGYAAFAFASGALIGAVLRRTLPAMAATLGLYAVVRVVIDLWVRPHLLPALHKTVSLLGAGGFGFISENGSPVTLVAKASAGQNTWTLGTQIFTRAGHPASAAQLSAFVQHYCPAIATPPAAPPLTNHPVRAPLGAAEAFQACREQAARTFHLVVTYQPAGRYWTFQWLELGIYLALALLAIAGCYRWITRHAR